MILDGSPDPWILGSLETQILNVRYHSLVLAGSLDPWILRNLAKKIDLFIFGCIPISMDPFIL